jgi:hypothetical protein
MKKFALLFLMTISYFSYSQNQTEYCILRITNSIKTTGIESKLYLDIGTNQTHSLKNVFINNKNGTITVKKADGSSLIISDEIDFLNIIEQYGFKLIHCYSTSVLEKTYVSYLFEKRNQ